MISKMVELHHLLKAQFPTFTGVTRTSDGTLTLTWESPPPRNMAIQAEVVVNNFDWTEKPEPTEAEVESKLSQLTPTARQSLIEQMLKQYLLDRPGLLETL